MRSIPGSPAADPVRFGRYVLIDRLGLGGMAEVFRALVLGPEQFQRVVVVKRILPSLCANPAFIKMFIDEARVCGRLSHPNVIQVHEFGRQQQHYFIAMEYVHGRNLNHILARLVELGQAMPVTVAADIIRQACRGLAYAHGLRAVDGKPLGIVHRDVSPGNVIVAYTGDAKVLDFGVARVENRFRLGTTDPGHVKGKASYLAPEQLTGQGVDHRADIFAAGILLYEMLTTSRLFKSPSATDSMDMVRSMHIPAPSQSNPQVPPALDAIVARALQRPVESRYQDAGQMADELEAFLLEQRFGSQEVPAFMHRLFPEESGGLQLPFDPSTLEAVRVDESAEGTAGLYVVADLGPGSAGSRGTPPPPSALEEWPELNAELDSPAPQPRRGRGLVWLAAAAVALGLGAVGAQKLRAPAAPLAIPAGASSIAPAPPPPVADPAPAAVVPADVGISISSEPPGATVNQGDSTQTLGVTPLEMRLPRGRAPVVFHINKAGYVEGQLKLVPDSDRSAVVSLARLNRRRAVKAPATEKVRNAVPLDPFGP
jgi:serine/threonine protein kinase